MPHSPPHRGHLLLGAAILGAAVALVPVGQRATASGSICVGIVLDYGNPSSPPSSVVPPATVTQSVSVVAGTSDEQALADGGDSIAANASGLICAINGYPADGVQNCTATSGDDFYFWSYWQGNPATNAWTYASVGPASHTVNNGDTYVEGWRYQNPGPASPTATPPAVTPATAFARACPGVTPASTSSGASGTGSTGASSGSGPSGPAVTTTSAPDVSGSQSGGTPSSGSTPPGGSVSSGSSGRSATTTTSAHSGAAGSTPSSSTTAPPTTTGGAVHATTGGSARRLAAAAASTSEHPPGGSPLLPVVVVTIIVVALGATAVFRWRRRPNEE